MESGTGKEAQARAIIAAAMQGVLTEAQARQLYAFGPEAVTLALLATAKQIAEQNGRIAAQDGCIAELQAKLAGGAFIGPSTPSGQVPVYAKPRTPRRTGRPGAKPGHPGARRAAPEQIDRREDHRLDCCPDCGGPVQRCDRKRTRTIEDLLAELRTEVVEHTVWRDYCPACKTHVEPVVPDALPNAALGHRVVTLTSWLHYGLGVTIEQIIDILGYHHRTRLTAGGLVAMWQRLARLLGAWYEQIGREARASAVLHADETGWRVAGQTWWLWCFANGQVCYYMIDRSRGSPALERFLIEAFEGVLVHDFWAAYEWVWTADHQVCWVHLLRELETVDGRNASTEWRAFAQRLRRALRDAMRLRCRADFTPDRYAGRVDRLDRRLMALAEGTYADADASRLAKRLYRHRDRMLTFLTHADVPYENNLAERMIRPAVVLRKHSQCNRSEKGAATQAVLMTVYRTLRLRGHDPLDTLVTALRTSLTTGSLPPLPGASTADG